MIHTHLCRKDTSFGFMCHFLGHQKPQKKITLNLRSELEVGADDPAAFKGPFLYIFQGAVTHGPNFQGGCWVHGPKRQQEGTK